jgi:hypothetical protein
MKDLAAFLLWMNRKKICSVIPFFVIQDGRNGKIPHWTDGKKLFDAIELIDLYLKEEQPKEAIQEQRWIPVSENLPEAGVEVLVWSERYGRTFATFLNQNKYGYIWRYQGDDMATFNAPSHWQSLPSKPSFTEQEQSTK